MPVRNRHRIGDHLVTDDRTGHVYYASETVREWTGLLVKKGSEDPRHPQEFVRAMNDPVALTDVRPIQGTDIDELCLLLRAEFVPGSGVRRIPNEWELDRRLPGIGEMAIGIGTPKGFDFVVESD